MGIWAHRHTFEVWDPDYQPENRTGEIWIHTASSWNDCIRLDVCEPSPGQFDSISSVMLDREMAAGLAKYLQLYADTGVAAFEFPAAVHTDDDECINTSSYFYAELSGYRVEPDAPRQK